MKNLDERFLEFLDRIGVKFETATDLASDYETGMGERIKRKEEFMKTFAPSFPLRPSSSLACGRRLFYELTNFYKAGTYPVEPMGHRQERIFKAGDLFEEYELSRLESMHNFKITHRQQRIEVATIGSEVVRGSIDALLWHNDGEVYLLDIKSITTYQFKEVKDMVSPKITNVAQLSLYACSPGFQALMQELGVKKVRCALFYVNKDNLDYTIIKFDPNPKLYLALIKRFSAIYNQYIKGTLPPRDFATTRYPCSYCAFKSYCQPQSDPDLTIKVDDPKEELSEEELILYLWQYGDSSTYESDLYTYSIEQLATKWKAVVKEKESGKVKKKKAASDEKPKRARKK